MRANKINHKELQKGEKINELVDNNIKRTSIHI
jgi:hypothetical protein